MRRKILSLRRWLLLWLSTRPVDSKDAATEIGRNRRRAQDEKVYKFVTRPDIEAVRWDITIYDHEALGHGYWFVAPYENLDQDEHGAAWVGPHIYDQHGELVWSGSPMFKRWNTFDFGVTRVDGEQMLSTLFAHDNTGVILDSQYQIYRTVALGKNASVSDMHDFNVIENGRSALVTTKAFNHVSWEISQTVGFDGECFAKFEGFRELDVHYPTLDPIFAWNPELHIELIESTFNINSIEDMCGKGWDLLHSNAIDKFPDGDYLLSARHTDTLYKISHHNGSIIWRLGGVKSDFDLIGDAKFSRQHHARVRGQNETHIIITLFDNAVGTGPEETPTRAESRGLLLVLSTNTTGRMTAEVAAEYKHPRGQLTNSRGSFSFLSNGNAFLCWTYSTRISEHRPDGTVIMEAALKMGKHSYRAYKYPWKGQPIQPPDVYAQAVTMGDALNTMVYVSWNGATEVVRWKVYKSDLRGVERLIASVPRQGFETSIECDGYASYVIVEAIDENGNSIGRSEVFQTILPSSEVFSPNAIKEAKWVQGWHYADSEAMESTSGVVIFALGFAGAVAAWVLAIVLWCWKGRQALDWWQNTHGYDLLWKQRSASAMSP